MADNTPIESWTLEQCKEYLEKYPKSLKSEAVRKRYDALILVKEQEDAKRREKEEELFWSSHKGNVKGILQYMEAYPKGKYVETCDDLCWKRCRNMDDVEAYMAHFRKGKHYQECDDAFWSFLKKSQYSLPSEKERYIKLFSKGKHLPEFDDLLWESSKDNTAGINNYKELFPKGRHVNETQSAYEKVEKEEISRQILPFIGVVLCFAAVIAIIWAAIKCKEWSFLVACGPFVWLGNRLSDKYL